MSDDAVTVEDVRELLQELRDLRRYKAETEEIFAEVARFKFEENVEGTQ